MITTTPPKPSSGIGSPTLALDYNLNVSMSESRSMSTTDHENETVGVADNFKFKLNGNRNVTVDMVAASSPCSDFSGTGSYFVDSHMVSLDTSPAPDITSAFTCQPYTQSLEEPEDQVYQLELLEEKSGTGTGTGTASRSLDNNSMNMNMDLFSRKLYNMLLVVKKNQDRGGGLTAIQSRHSRKVFNPYSRPRSLGVGVSVGLTSKRGSRKYSLKRTRTFVVKDDDCVVSNDVYGFGIYPIKPVEETEEDRIPKESSRKRKRDFDEGFPECDDVETTPCPSQKRQKKILLPLGKRRDLHCGRTASLRKAASLGIDNDRLRSQQFISENFVPTEPVTPNQFQPSQNNDDLSSIPIIDPPSICISRAPLSTEMSAKIKLGRYKEREGRTLEHDYTRSLGISDERDSVLNSIEVKGVRKSLGTGEQWEMFLGMGIGVREARVDWLLQYLPRGDESSGSSSGSSFSSDSSSENYLPRRFRKSRLNLISQMIASPETRFHAVWMFLRYFYMIALKDSREGNRNTTSTPTTPLVPDLIAWDMTLASLAISVKFHRDFLHPLSPVEAFEYMDISPHNMGFSDLELAQRHMLSNFSYELGVTPQPFIEQTWIALPSLRKLVAFEGGWNQVQKETWWILLNSLYLPDVYRFSVSALTTAALKMAIVSVLTQRLYFQSDWNNFFNFVRTKEKGDMKVRSKQKPSRIPMHLTKLAEEEVECVVGDIQGVIGVSDEELKECLDWMDQNKDYVTEE